MIKQDKITIQSMTTTRTSDVEATAAQIKRLEALGCDIVRVAVQDLDSADAISQLKERIAIPLVADIHFDHRLALRAVERGADKIRINPGNIGGADNVKAVADACRRAKIPIRVGVNSGSLEKRLIEKHGGVTAEAMAESVMGHIELLNRFDFDDIWLSAKASSVKLMTQTYRLLHEMTKNSSNSTAHQARTLYPLHVGVTEAGTEYSGIIKNAIGIGSLLLDGIGDTIRVSLTAEPEREVLAAKAILKALGLRHGIDIISCPTCGRCDIDVISMAQQVENALEKQAGTDENLTVAVMGCAVNGPGEASHADYGIAGGGRNSLASEAYGIIFAKGKIVKKAPEHKLVDELLELVNKRGQA